MCDFDADYLETVVNQQKYLQRLWYLQRMKPYELLQELLATIHGDGGALVSEQGCAKAVIEAECRWNTMAAAAIAAARAEALESRDDPAPDSVSGG